jgi:hypothetical protein
LPASGREIVRPLTSTVLSVPAFASANDAEAKLTLISLEGAT